MSYATPYNGPTRIVSIEERRTIVQSVLGQNVDWVARDGGEWGYCECPGLSNHSGKNGRRDCRVWAVENGSKPPGVHCLHTSCATAVEEMSRKIRSAIGKAKADVPDAKRKPGFAPARGTWRPSAHAMHERALAKTTGTPPTPSPATIQATPRTPADCNTAGGQSQFRTDRTHILNPLSHYARAQVRARTHAHTPTDSADHPSDASGVAQPVAKPPQPEPAKPVPTRANAPAAPTHSTPDDVECTEIIGGTVHKGRYENGKWVPLQKPRSL